MKQKKYKVDHFRLEKLLNEKEIQKKEICYLWKCLPQMYSQKIKGGLSSEELQAVAVRLGVDCGYLTGEKIYKNFEEMKEKESDKLLLQERATKNFLQSFGFEILGIARYLYSGKYYTSESLPPECDAATIYKVETPNHEIKYLNSEQLENLTNDFFILLNSRLIEQEVATTWDFEF